MKGKDLIKMIKEKKLEDHDFCVTNRQCGYLKRSATTIGQWDDAQEKSYGGSYDTGKNGNGKVAILSDTD